MGAARDERGGTVSSFVEGVIAVDPLIIRIFVDLFKHWGHHRASLKSGSEWIGRRPTYYWSNRLEYSSTRLGLFHSLASLHLCVGRLA